MTALLFLVVVAQADDVFEALKDPNRDVRERAVVRLARADGPTLPLLRARLFDADARVATGVVAALARRGDPGALPDLVRLADAADPARGEAAALAAADLAARTRTPFPALHFEGMRLLPRRLERVVAAAVPARLGTLGRFASLDRPQHYRYFYAAGAYAERALADFLRDGEAAAGLRAHALHAYTRLVGRRARPVLADHLGDPETAPRRAAAELVWRYGGRTGLERLAALLESPRPLDRGTLLYAAAAAGHLKSLGDRGAQRLARGVREWGVVQGAAAAAALAVVRPDEAARAVRARVRRLLDLEAARAGGGLGVAAFVFRAGPLPADLHAVAATGHPLLRAAVTADRDEARALVRPFLHPATPDGGRENFRILILHRVLAGAPASERAAFARSLLRHDAAAHIRGGLRVLRDVPAELWDDLVPLALRGLDDGHESLRLAAAALFPGRARAVAACLDALYDGDPAAARAAADVLGRARPLWAIDPAAPVAERRRLAAELGRRNRLARDDKE